MNTFAPHEHPSFFVKSVALLVAGLAILLSSASARASATDEFLGSLAWAIEPGVAKELGLSEQQKADLTKLVQSREDAALEMVMQAGGQSPSERADKLAAFRAESEARGVALLTPEQRTLFPQIVARRAGVRQPLPSTTMVPAPAAPGGAFAGTPAGPPPGPPAMPGPPAGPGGGGPADNSALLNEAPSAAPPDSSGGGALPPGATGKIRFNFRSQPWRDVLEWFAQQAGLSFVLDAAPLGTFNYTDDREYTPAEALDLLNSVLLTKGYTLLRRDRMLMLINLEDGIPPNLVSTISEKDLDTRGEFELVSVLFQLSRMNPDEAETEIKKLLGPQGSLITLPKSRQILVTETAGRLRAIRSVIERIESPEAGIAGRLQTFDLKYVLPSDALVILRQLLNIPADQNVSADGSIRLAIDPSGERLLVTGTSDALVQIGEILKTIDVAGPGYVDEGPGKDEPQLRVYSIASADPTAVLAVIQTLLAGMPDVRLDIDAKTGNLIALARLAQHRTIESTLAEMQRDSRQVEVIRLYKIDPQLAVLSINKLFGIGGTTPAASAPQVDADPTTRQLMVRGTSAQIEQIRGLLTKMGESEPAEGGAIGGTNVRMLPLNGRAVLSALDQMQEIWPSMRRNKIRVVTPSSVIGTMRVGKTGESDEPAEPRERPTPRRDGAAPIPEQSLPPTTLLPSVPQQPVPLQPIPQSSAPKSSVPESTPMPPPAPRFDETQTPPPSEPSTPPQDNSTALPAAAHVFFAVQTTETQPSVAAPPAGSAAESAAGSAPATAPAPADPPSTAATSEPLPRPKTSANLPAAPPAKAPSAAGPESEPAPIIVAPGPGGIMIASSDTAALDEFERLLTSLAGDSLAGGPEVTIFYLKHTKAEIVAETLDQIFGGGTIASSGGGGGGSLVGDLASAAVGGSAGGIIGSLLGGGGSRTIAPSGTLRITPDSRLNALIVQANQTDVQMVEDLLKILDQRESPEDILVASKARMIPVFNTDATEIADIVKQVYQDRMGGASRGGGGGGGPSPEQLIEMLRGGGRGGRGSSRSTKAEDVQKMSVGVDTRTNSLVVAAPEQLFEEVKQLVEQLDQAAELQTPETVKTVRLHQIAPSVVQDALVGLMGDSVQFSSSTSTGSRSSSGRSRSGSSSQPQPGPPSGPGFTPGGMFGDPGRREMFFRMLQERQGGGGGPFGGGPFGGGDRGGRGGRGGRGD